MQSKYQIIIENNSERERGWAKSSALTNDVSANDVYGPVTSAIHGGLT